MKNNMDALKPENGGNTDKVIKKLLPDKFLFYDTMPFKFFQLKIISKQLKNNRRK